MGSALRRRSGNGSELIRNDNRCFILTLVEEKLELVQVSMKRLGADSVIAVSQPGLENIENRMSSRPVSGPGGCRDRLPWNPCLASREVLGCLTRCDRGRSVPRVPSHGGGSRIDRNFLPAGSFARQHFCRWIPKTPVGTHGQLQENPETPALPGRVELFSISALLY